MVGKIKAYAYQYIAQLRAVRPKPHDLHQALVELRAERLPQIRAWLKQQRGPDLVNGVQN
ncbi:hypothetical protein [Pseudoxanthomonas composti]|uniref:Uncharacterized protein n=1 Tax=Pseudoxanthomonas composti TaxID=2137479 RepID=A0A4Q1JVU7_9GAMM|nr:hypothetical protein [Pseudoxanthomonas composti]RXR05319.1 hypothetical protein EPA99_11300 [Pseudoxanthomonas composti]